MFFKGSEIFAKKSKGCGIFHKNFVGFKIFMGNYKGSENFYCSRYGDPRNAKLWNLLEDKLLISSHTRPQTHYFKFFQTVTRSSAGKKEILGGLKLIILKMSKNMIRGAKIFLKNLTLPRLGGGQNDPRLSKSPLNTRKWKNSKMKIQKTPSPSPHTRPIPRDLSYIWVSRPQS